LECGGSIEDSGQQPERRFLLWILILRQYPCGHLGPLSETGLFLSPGRNNNFMASLASLRYLFLLCYNFFS
jgi:hypothetical protein